MYNGHKNWNHWNVSLWLFNDEPLYRHMCHLVRMSRTKDIAAKEMLYALQCWNTPDPQEPEQATPHTPDGAPYTFTSVRAALSHWEG
jgi:hypothetical protein